MLVDFQVLALVEVDSQIAALEIKVVEVLLGHSGLRLSLELQQGLMFGLQKQQFCYVAEVAEQVVQHFHWELGWELEN